MRAPIVFILLASLSFAFVPNVAADDAIPAAAYRSLFGDSSVPRIDPWRVTWGSDEAPMPIAASSAPAFDDAQQPRPRVVATEYSDAYKMRARIHRIASFASLPLFGTEVYLGQSVYNGSGGGRRSAHIAVGTAIGALFAVNTVTGVWNLWEGRKDPTRRTQRFAHALLMLAADAGFLATAAVAPEREDDEGFSSFNDRRGTHRAVALTSIGLGTAGYLVMLLGGR